MFLLSFANGSKSAEGGKNPLPDMDPGGPNPLGHRQSINQRAMTLDVGEWTSKLVNWSLAN